MNQEKGFCAAAMFEGDDSIWWVTGGYIWEGNWDEFDTTEVFDVQTNEFNFDIDLPLDMYKHNLVNGSFGRSGDNS